MNKFDIYWAKYLKDESKLKSKQDLQESDFTRRPVLILDNDIIIKIAKITTHTPHKNYQDEYIIKNWRAANLVCPSTIRFSKKDLVTSECLLDKIGHLSEEDIKAIKEAKLVEKLQEAQQQSAVKSNGVYSVMKDEWIKEPVQADIPDLDEEAFDKLFTEWEDKYFDLINKQGLTSEEVEDFIEDIYDLRKTSIATEGEYSLGNLVFKECRNLGYLDNLKDLKNEIKSKELSLEGLKEDFEDEKNEAEVFWNLRDPKSTEATEVFARIGKHMGNLYYNPETKQIELIKNYNEILNNKFSVSCEHQDKDFGKVVKKRFNKFMSLVNGEFVVYFYAPGDPYGNEYSVITSDQKACDEELYAERQEAYAAYGKRGNWLGNFVGYKDLTTGKIIIAFIKNGKMDDEQLVTEAINKVIKKEIKNLNLKKRTFKEA